MFDRAIRGRRGLLPSCEQHPLPVGFHPILGTEVDPRNSTNAITLGSRVWNCNRRLNIEKENDAHANVVQRTMRENSRSFVFFALTDLALRAPSADLCFSLLQPLMTDTEIAAAMSLNLEEPRPVDGQGSFPGRPQPFHF